MAKQKLLLVDDEPQNLQLLRQVLKDDYDLIYASSGVDALNNALSQHPDMILLDVMMPDMDGHEVCRRLKSDNRCCHIPIIFVTAMGGVSDENRGRQLGAVDYIVKPIRPAAVRTRIRSLLQLYSQ